ncbi:transaldolase family protein [Planctomycetota bacterium]
MAAKQDNTSDLTGQSQCSYEALPIWERFAQAGTQLWIDANDCNTIEKYWTHVFSGIDVHQIGLEFELSPETSGQVIPTIMQKIQPSGTSADSVQQILSKLQIQLGLYMVQRFKTRVVVAIYAANVHDVEKIMDFARQACDYCPKQFIINIPWSPGGLLAARKLRWQGIAVMITQVFSARQSYIAARLAQPAFVNMSLTPLHDVVLKNQLGGGLYVGEKALLASQRTIKKLRHKEHLQTYQVASGFTDGCQLQNVTGVDVMSLSPHVIEDYLSLPIEGKTVFDRTDYDYMPLLNRNVDLGSQRFESLWQIDDTHIACMDKLLQEDLDSIAPEDLVSFGYNAGCEDLFVTWKAEERGFSQKEGPIPDLNHWATDLSRMRIGLDTLLNFAGLNALTKVQAELERHIAKTCAK